MALLAAIARHQLLTAVFVSRRGVEVILEPRAKGGLTGSILAMTLARIPVESSFVNLYPTCALRGFPVGKCRVVFGAWVDNIYCASEDPADAYRNLTEVFNELSRVWGLELKEGSVSVLVSNGFDCSDFSRQFQLPVPNSVEVLGWQFSRSGSISLIWRELIRKAWGIFQANIQTRNFRALGTLRRLALVERTVKPFLLYKLQPYGAIKSFVSKLRSLQRVMVSRALGNYRLPYEAWKDFRRRCSVQAKSCIGHCVSDWADLWIRSTLSWDDHLQREFERQHRFLEDHPQDDIRLVLGRSVWPLSESKLAFHSTFSWAPLLSRHHAASWFESLRSFFRVGPRVSSRTNTRSCKGFVQTRWHDAVAQSRELTSGA